MNELAVLLNDKGCVGLRGYALRGCKGTIKRR